MDEKEEVYIIDIDGTLSKLNGRNPYKYLQAGEDLVNEPVKEFILNGVDKGIEIILLSGRGSSARKTTISWLAYHGIPYTKLYMKPDNDHRKAVYYKADVLQKEIMPKYKVLVCLDDYKRNLNMFLSYGLKTILVDEQTGKFTEFTGD